MEEYKTLDQAKEVFANESASELALFDYSIIEQLIQWLDDNGRDGSYADYLYDIGNEEIRCLMAEASAEFDFKLGGDCFIGGILWGVTE